jgi:hypothetical protein
MYLSKPVSALVQTERHPVAAFKWPMLLDLGEALRAPSIQVIDTEMVGKSPQLPRKSVPVQLLSAVGKTCLDRMKLEYERRFSDNTTETLTGADVKFKERDGLCAMLDPRTNSMKHMENRSGAPSIREMKDKLETEYVKFGMRALAWKTAKEVESAQEVVEVHSPDSTHEEEDAAAPIFAEGLLSPESPEKSHGVPARATLSREQEKAKADDELKDKLKNEFNKSFNEYIKQSAKIKWSEVPGVQVPTLRKLMWQDLWEADMGYVLRHFFLKDDPEGTKYGYLPKMALASKGMMCALMASSFCERINSCAVEVVDERNTLLSQDEIDKVTVLRMNKEFMEFMRKEYPEVMTLKTSHRSYGTVVTMDMTKEDNVESEGIDDQPKEIDMA